MSVYDYDLWNNYFQDPELVKYYVTENYVQLASASLLFYDFFLTFGDEVQLFYRHRRKLPTLLIVLIRYNAFLSAAATLLSGIHFTKYSEPHLSVSTCRGLLFLGVASQIAATVFVSAFVTLRIIALWWPQSRWIGVFIFIGGLIAPSSFRSVFILPRGTVQVAPWPMPTCVTVLPPTKSISLQSAYIPVAVSAFSISFELLCWVLTVMKTWKTYRVHLKNGPRTRLSSLLLRDGSLYFIMLAVLAAFEILGSFELALPKGLGASFSQSLIPIFTTRFIARLRQTVDGDDTLNTVEVSDANFQRQPTFSRTQVVAAFGGQIHGLEPEEPPERADEALEEQNDSEQCDSEEQGSRPSHGKESEC